MKSRNMNLFAMGGRHFASILLWASILTTMALASASAGTLNNTAHATGTAPGAVTVISTDDTINLPVTIKDPKYTVNKSVANGTVTNGSNNATVDAPGDTFVYTIAVKNTGNVTLSDPALTDPGPRFGGVLHTGPYSISAIPTSGDDGDSNFEIGETWNYVVTYIVTQTDINNASAGGGTVANTVSVAVTDPQGTAVLPDTVATSVPTASTSIVTTSSLTIDKTATVSTDGGTTFATMTALQKLNVGDIVKFAFLVTNTGNTTLTNVSVVEGTFNGAPAITIPSNLIATLLPGASQTLTAANYTVTQADIDGLQ